MKTTLEIEDSLLVQAKTVAAQRRTTLRAVVEHALRREVEPKASEDYDRLIEIAEDGMPRYKRTDGGTVTSEQIYQLMEEEGI
ncbi:MAG: type II toxin-antitoxin system VapB family antitoxin [Verrucomicrobiota bacterium]